MYHTKTKGARRTGKTKNNLEEKKRKKMYEPKQQSNHVAETSEGTGSELGMKTSTSGSTTTEYSGMREEEKASIPALLVRRMSSLQAKFDQVKARREDLRKARELSQQTLRQSIQAKQERAAEVRKSLWNQERERKKALTGSVISPTDSVRSIVYGGVRPDSSPDPSGTCKRLCYLFSRLELMKRQAEHEKRHIVASWKKKKTLPSCDEFDHLSGSPLGRQNGIKELLECAATCIQNAWIYRRATRIYRDLLNEMAFLLVLLESDCTEESTDSVISLLTANRTLPVKMQQFLSRLNWPFLERGKVSLEDTRYFIMAFYHICTGEFTDESGRPSDSKTRGSTDNLLLFDDCSTMCAQCNSITLEQAARMLVSAFLHFDFTVKSSFRMFLIFQLFKEHFRTWQLKDKANLVQELHEFSKELEDLRESVQSQVDYEDVWKERIDSQQERIDKKIQQLESNRILLEESSNFISQSSSETTTSDNKQTKAESREGGPKNFNSSAFLFGTFSKQELIHEIFMTSNFRMENFLVQKFNQHSETDFLSFDDFLQANKDKLYDWIDDVNNNSRTIDIIHYIKTKLFELAPQRGNHRKEIDDFFDIPHLNRKLSNGLLDVAEMLEFSLGKMKQLCAPVRDYEIDSLLQQLSSHSVELRAIFIGTVQLIDKMTFDMMNFLTQTIKPHVIYNVVEYEQSCLSNEWFFNEHDCQLLEGASEGLPVNFDEYSLSSSKKKMSLFYTAIFHSRHSSFDSTSLLDVLEFDRSRIENLFQLMQQFSMIGAISIILKSQLGISQETSKLSLLNSILPDQQQTNAPPSNNSPLLSAAMEIVHRQTKDEELINCIQRICTRITSHKDTLYELFHGRLVDFCRKQFDYGRYSILNSGYEAFEKEIQRFIIEPFERIFLTNFNIYSTYFDQFFTLQRHDATK